MYFILSPFISPSFRSILCWVSWVLNILDFHSTKHICVEFHSYSKFSAVRSKTYLHWVRFIFKITGRQSVLIVSLAVCLPRRWPKWTSFCHKNKRWSAHLLSPSHRFPLKPEVKCYPYCDWFESNRNPDSFVVNSPCDWQKNVGWPQLNSLHCKYSILALFLYFSCISKLSFSYFLFSFLLFVFVDPAVHTLHPAPSSPHPEPAFLEHPDKMAFSELVSSVWRPCLFSAIGNRCSNETKTFMTVHGKRYFKASIGYPLESFLKNIRGISLTVSR